MNAFKLVCSDIDGTLLNDDHELTEETKHAVKVIDEQGIPFILTSARMPQAIEPLQNALEIRTPMICYSGALVLDKLSEQGENTVIANECMPSDQTTSIFYLLEKKFPEIVVSFYSYDQWIVENQYDQAIKLEQDITNVIPIEKEIDMFLNTKPDIHKILCIGNKHEISKIEALLTETYEKLSIYKSKDDYLEIMAPNVSKANAMHHLADYYNIKTDDMIAIGDNFNDLDMLAAAGLGIAMGNAPELIKQSADEITLSNNENGLAKVIDKYFVFE